MILRRVKFDVPNKQSDRNSKIVVTRDHVKTKTGWVVEKGGIWLAVRLHGIQQHVPPIVVLLIVQSMIKQRTHGSCSCGGCVVAC